MKHLSFSVKIGSGKSVKAKLAEVREAIQKLNAESFIVTALDDIACKSIHAKR